MGAVELKDVVLIIVSAIVGILMGQASGYLERRSERRRVFNRVLAELLEIRHRFQASVYVLRRLGKDLAVPRDYLDVAVSQFPEGLLWDAGISERYNEAISTLSSHAPILAYALRSKDIVRFMFNGTPIKFGSSEETHALALMQLDLVERSVVPVLNESIEAVAGLLGRRIKAVSKEILAGSEEVLLSVKSSADELIENFNSSMPSAAVLQAEQA
ncbi:MAG: hypothetical protein REI94_08400 [Moraxellaceae bacterium]|nr:hypothetical protein [Moraxellaceae bacterium]